MFSPSLSLLRESLYSFTLKTEAKSYFPVVCIYAHKECPLKLETGFHRTTALSGT